MAELLLALIPLGIGGALVPVQIIITLLLLQSASGRITAVAWLAGMTVVRLLQGVLFGLILGVGAASSEGPGRASWLALLVVAIAFYVMAVRKWLKQPDDDAPPPAWVERVGSVTPSRAFLLGAGLLVLSVKQWVFTLAAIAAIAEEESLGQTGSIAAYLLFVVLAQSVNLAAVTVAYAMPERAGAVFGRLSDALARYDRPILIVVGLVFGTWFLLNSLRGLGIL